MGKPDMVGWFDANWMRQRELAMREGFDSLSRRDQVLVAVGFLIDSCIGDGEWAVVDGVVEGQDEGLTRRMPAALEDIGASEAAQHVREIIRLRAPTQTPEQDEANRDQAVEHWEEIARLFDKWIPKGERVMLTQLYEWYHSHPSAKL